GRLPGRPAGRGPGRTPGRGVRRRPVAGAGVVRPGDRAPAHAGALRPAVRPRARRGVLPRPGGGAGAPVGRAQAVRHQARSLSEVGVDTLPRFAYDANRGRNRFLEMDFIPTSWCWAAAWPAWRPRHGPRTAARCPACSRRAPTREGCRTSATSAGWYSERCSGRAPPRPRWAPESGGGDERARGGRPPLPEPPLSPDVGGA